MIRHKAATQLKLNFRRAIQSLLTTKPRKGLVLGTAALTLALLLAYLLYVANEIAHQSTQDEARSADVILVLGAAEYRGAPSPVLKARLNHALLLYLRHYAPYILTTGGAGGDPRFTEGEVGRDYLIGRGVPSEDILVVPEGETTGQSLSAASELMNSMDLHSCVVVSDGYHIYRVKRYLQARDIRVYGSPRPTDRPPGSVAAGWLYLRQAVAFVLWQVGISV